MVQFPINPYGKAKKMAEDIILDFSKNSDMAVMILRFVQIHIKFLSMLFKYSSFSSSLPKLLLILTYFLYVESLLESRHLVELTCIMIS